MHLIWQRLCGAAPLRHTDGYYVRPHSFSLSIPLRSSGNIPAYLIPEDGILLISTHRQGITLEAQIHRRVMVSDIWHVLQRVKIEVKGFGVQSMNHSKENEKEKQDSLLLEKTISCKVFWHFICIVTVWPFNYPRPQSLSKRMILEVNIRKYTKKTKYKKAKCNMSQAAPENTLNFYYSFLYNQQTDLFSWGKKTKILGRKRHWYIP